jgi:hypothetical protein
MQVHSKGMEDPDYEAIATLPHDHSLLQPYMYIYPKDMDDADYAATSTLPNAHSVLHIYMYLHSKPDLENPYYEATPTLLNDH